MIERVQGRHFSCHDFIDVALDPHTTTIIGQSASGKSALLRLIKWVLTNRPQGDSFVGDWRKAEFAKGTVWIDGHRVSRKRGAGVNSYTLDGEVLKAFGAGVPQPVADVANVADLNWQGQLDGPYLFTASTAEVSRELNRVVNLSAIDRAMQAAGREVRKAKARVEVSSERLAGARKALAKTTWVEKFDARLRKVERLYTRIDEIRTRRARIDDLLSGMAQAAQRRDRASDAILAQARAIQAIEAWREKRDRLEKVRALLDRLVGVDRRLCVPKLDLGRLRKLLDEIKARRERLRKTQSLLFALEQSQWEVDQWQERIREVGRKLKTLVGSRCAACGQRIRPSPS